MTLALEPDESTLLRALLRARPESVRELEGQVPIGGERLRSVLAALAARGLVEIDGESIRMPAPEVAVTTAAGLVLQRHRRELDDLDAFLGSLPGVLRDWTLGETADASIPVELVHGTTNQWNLWMRLMAETPPQAPIAVFPDFAGLATIVVENLDMLVQAKAAVGFTLRTITLPSALGNQAEREQLVALAAAGIEMRTLPVVPGWFYVDAGVLAALPLAWGEAVPSSIALVRDPAVLAPLAAYIESLWHRASPVPEGSGGWDPVLELLAQGLSDGAIASALDTSLRTVRRRIAEASAAHGATSRFALGVEWQRARTT